MGMLLLGAQFISMGFLAELFTAYYGRTSVPYSIKAARRASRCREEPRSMSSDEKPSNDSHAALVGSTAPARS